MLKGTRVLVTGDKGYIGSVLTTELLERGCIVTGLDTGYYADCLLRRPFVLPVDRSGCEGRDRRRSERHRRRHSSGRAVERSARRVLASYHRRDQSARGYSPGIAGPRRRRRPLHLLVVAEHVRVASTDHELDEDDSEKNPITAYARTKWEAELALRKLGSDEFVVVCFRPSTVFGASPRLRCDIVFNNLVACAFTTGRIEIKSDGTPWRPAVHVRDVCAAFLAGLEAPANWSAARSYNVGIRTATFRYATWRTPPAALSGQRHRLHRRARLGFAHLSDRVHAHSQRARGLVSPGWDLTAAARSSWRSFAGSASPRPQFRGRATNRLLQLKHLRESGRLDGSVAMERAPRCPSRSTGAGSASVRRRSPVLDLGRAAAREQPAGGSSRDSAAVSAGSLPLQRVRDGSIDRNRCSGSAFQALRVGDRHVGWSPPN